jgi:hypothetical protein
MGILGDAIGRSSASPAPPSPTGTAAPPPPPQNRRADLERRRDELTREVTELHWDLGGLAYEMAIRDHFRLDVIVRRAAILQERDAELAEVERLLRMDEQGTAGSCPHCAAPHSRGALFCWQCGTTLMERLPSAATAAPQDTTEALDALLAPNGVGEPGSGAGG